MGQFTIVVTIPVKDGPGKPSVFSLIGHFLDFNEKRRHVSTVGASSCYVGSTQVGLSGVSSPI
ncbi:MAG: hypothetical protein J07HX5_02106 [halophilic archaeon J07HX5]|nr:MAG: hypothetical protein J07HX5_02106 [halophilic archaeon J07HX5]